MCQCLVYPPPTVSSSNLHKIPKHRLSALCSPIMLLSYPRPLLHVTWCFPDPPLLLLLLLLLIYYHYLILLSYPHFTFSTLYYHSLSATFYSHSVSSTLYSHSISSTFYSHFTSSTIHSRPTSSTPLLHPPPNVSPTTFLQLFHFQSRNNVSRPQSLFSGQPLITFVAPKQVLSIRRRDSNPVPPSHTQPGDLSLRDRLFRTLHPLCAVQRDGTAKPLSQIIRQHC